MTGTRLYRIIPEPQHSEELPGNARLEWVVPVTTDDVWIGQDGGEFVVYDGAGQAVTVVAPLGAV